jgi:hypothetical protein
MGFLIAIAIFFLAAFGSRFGVSGRYPVPRFAHSETNVTVNAGETAILVCRVENLGTRKVRSLNIRNMLN